MWPFTHIFKVRHSLLFQQIKGSDWISLVFEHMFPLNSKTAIAFANFISNGKVQVSPHGVASPYTIMMELTRLMGLP